MSSHALPFALRRRRALLGPLAALGVLCASGLAVERYLASARAVEATQESCTEEEEPCEPRLPEFERLTWIRGPLEADPMTCETARGIDTGDVARNGSASEACEAPGATSGERCAVRCSQRKLDEPG